MTVTFTPNNNDAERRQWQTWPTSQGSGVRAKRVANPALFRGDKEEPISQRPAARWAWRGAAALFLVILCAVTEAAEGSTVEAASWVYMLLASLPAALLAVPLPLTAMSYVAVRRNQREAEVTRIFKVLGIPPEHHQIYPADNPGQNFVLPVAFTTTLSMAGLTILMIGNDLGLANVPSLLLGGALINHHIDVVSYQQGALASLGFSFLGAHLWGLQNIFRRYAMNDLIPGAYYSLGVRMAFAAAVSLLVYHSLRAVTGDQEFGAGMFPAVAFLIGMFPQRGLFWITENVKILSQQAHPSVREMPLDMIEGVEIYDRVRLQELGIDNCHDLAVRDFVPLLLQTPYGARQILDWLLQAKLCVQVGAHIKDLREHGIRTIIDLADFDDDRLAAIARDTGLTETLLFQTRDAIEADYHNIKRLRAASEVLSRYWQREDEDKPRSRA